MKKKMLYAIIAVAVVCVLSVGAMIFALIHFAPEKQPFIPPEFDAAAVEGVVQETDELKILGWSKVEAEALPYVARICGRILIKDQKADLWFYNEPESEAWLKLRITDGEGIIIAETGLIKPGQYLQTVEFNRPLADDEKVAMKIMGYEPETYMSAGAVTLKTTVKNGK
jgi:hypothetical protein